MHPKRFLSAFGWKWVAIMTGTFSLICTALTEMGGPLPRWAFWGGAYVCMAITAFLVWRAEASARQEDADKARAELDALRRQIADQVAAFEALQKIRAAELVAFGAKFERREDATTTSLGKFMQMGQEIVYACCEEQSPPPMEAFQHWAAVTEEFLRSELGQSYVARFHDSSGLSMQACTIVSVPHRNIWAALRNRMARLNEFLAERHRAASNKMTT